MNQHDMKCEEVISHLLTYLDSGIDAARRVQIDRHLEACRGCYSRAEFERALQAKVRELGAEKASIGLKQRLRALLDRF
jgi:anti-sigma factor (TIGR02949 family)